VKSPCNDHHDSRSLPHIPSALPKFSVALGQAPPSKFFRSGETPHALESELSDGSRGVERLKPLTRAKPSHHRCLTVVESSICQHFDIDRLSKFEGHSRAWLDFDLQWIAGFGECGETGEPSTLDMQSPKKQGSRSGADGPPHISHRVNLNHTISFWDLGSISEPRNLVRLFFYNLKSSEKGHNPSPLHSPLQRSRKLSLFVILSCPV
jgi:hypothetical protein